MRLKEIIELFKDISVAHPEINSFHTGLNFEHNDSNIHYPALRMVFPYNLNYKQENKIMEYDFTLTLFVNDVKEEVMNSSKYINTNYLIEDSTLDESVGDLTDENKLRDRALGIMNNIMETLIEQENCKDYFEVTNYKIKALERANDDFVTGVTMTITIRTDNTYKCDYPNLIDCEGNVSWDTTNPCPQLAEPVRYSQSFNGVNQYGFISQQTTSLFDIDWRNPFSFECWYFYNPGTSAFIYNKVTAGAGYFVAAIGSRDVVRFQIRNTNPFNLIDVYSVDTLNAGWNHIVVTYNGNGGAEQDVTFTINNNESSKPNDWSQGSQLTGGTTTTSASLEIARITAFGIWSECIICHIRAWRNTELNSQEISTLYNNGKVLYENIPQSQSIMFETGFSDENESWLSQGWVMRELTGTSNLIYEANSIVADRIDDRP